MNARLALGTVQFGMRYGIMNKSGTAVSEHEAGAILALAWHRGVDMLDTAAAYGSATEVIAAARPAEASFALVTKMRPLGGADIDAPIDEIRRARAVLGIPAFYAVLLHQADDLLGANSGAAVRALDTLRDEGVCERLGVSVYDPETLDRVLDAAPIDVVQLPLNVLDQRFIRSGAVDRLKRRGIEVHVRSAFLQGILLAEPDVLPRGFASARLAAYQSARRQAGLSPAAGALRFVLGCPGVDRIVIGVDTVNQLRANLSAYDEARSWRGDFDYTPHMIDDLDIIDPRRWHKEDLAQ